MPIELCARCGKSGGWPATGDGELCQECWEIERSEDFWRAHQSHAAIVAAMAEQAMEDADCITEMLDAGCSLDECRAAFSDGKAVN